MKIRPSARRAITFASAATLLFASPAVASPENAVLQVAAEGQTHSSEQFKADQPDQSVASADAGASLELNACALDKDGNAQDPSASTNGANAVLVARGRGTMAYVSSGSAVSTGSVADGIFALQEGCVFANGFTVSATGAAARGVVAASSGVVVANALLVQLQGALAPALSAEQGGMVSVAGSTLTTTGQDAPILSSRGELEIDDVRGVTVTGSLSEVLGGGRVLVNNSRLDSTRSDDAVGVNLSGSGSAEFQAANSTLSLKGTSGNMFEASEATANIVLVSTPLKYDHEALGLLHVTKGAKADLTFINEEASGDVTVDDGEATVWLRKGSVWKGTVESDGKTNVNVCPTSTWVLTKNAAVNDLNVKDGGKIVDQNGREVPVRQGDKTLRGGNSDLSVEVAGEYSTTFEIGGKNELAEDLVGRGGFDKRFNLTTSFRMGFDSSGTDWTDCHCGASGSSNVPTEVPWWESAWNAIVGFFQWLLGLS